MNLLKTKIYLAFLPATIALSACATDGDIERDMDNLDQAEIVEEGDELRSRRAPRPSSRPSDPRQTRPTPMETISEPPLDPSPDAQADATPDTEPEESIEPIPEVDDAPAADPEPDPELDSESSEPEPDLVASYGHPLVQEALRLPRVAFSYEPQDLPDAFARDAALANNAPLDNDHSDALSDERATLGRVLFYDTKLSLNESVSCASCHQQDLGFSDDATLSEGFDGGLTGRNSMPIVNVGYYANGAMFWDERALTLEHQVLMPIQDEIEMGMSLDALVSRLESTPYYPILFELAFGDTEITEERISLALAHFNRSIISHNTRYDQALALANGDPRRPFAMFSAEENSGKDLFFRPARDGGAGCAGCHLAPPQAGAPRPTSIFFVNGASNNGLTDGRDPSDDPGLGAVTGRAADLGKFKSPTLRQTALTAPYMHNGSLETLRDVIDHYSEGVRAHPNLDPRLRQPNGAPQRLNLSEAEKVALEAFLHTLTDEQLNRDERFADPFR